MTAATRVRPPKADAACLAAVDLARAALADLEDAGPVGDHLGHTVEAERVVTHWFECRLPGYTGWRWAVTVARASRAKTVTVDETTLLPGPEALLAPAWVPWSDRIRPGDLGAGDLLPTPADDPRLVPGWTGADEEPDPQAVRSVVEELGLGRARVLSPYGREEAAERWYAGDGGPDTEVARSAPGRCASCGFLVPVGGPLRLLFGVCANENTPFDGEVVSADHGCGGHSEAAVVPEPVELVPVHDTLSDELLAHGSVSGADRAEELGHS